MFSILKSNLVNPFEPLGETLKQALDDNVHQSLIERQSNSSKIKIFFDPDQQVIANVIADEDCVFCGAPWVDSLIEKVSQEGFIQWHVIEGAVILAGSKVCTLHGKAKDILPNEKIILNFLCLLSSIATDTRAYIDLISETNAILYYDCVHIPGLALVQDYAVRVGGGHGYSTLGQEDILLLNHHLRMIGGVSVAIEKAFSLYPADFVKIEVASLSELEEAIQMGVKQVRLKDFSLEKIEKALLLTQGKVLLEVCGSVYLKNISQIAQMGISRIIVDDCDKNKHRVKYSLWYDNT